MSRQRAALSSAIPPKFGGKRGTECLNTSVPMPTLLYAVYSVTLIYLILGIYGRRKCLRSVSLLHIYVVSEIFDFTSKCLVKRLGEI